MDANSRPIIRCICNRPSVDVHCSNVDCSFKSNGRVRRNCSLHPKVTYLMDLASCPLCLSECVESDPKVPIKPASRTINIQVRDPDLKRFRPPLTKRSMLPLSVAGGDESKAKACDQKQTEKLPEVKNCFDKPKSGSSDAFAYQNPALKLPEAQPNSNDKPERIYMFPRSLGRKNKHDESIDDWTQYKFSKIRLTTDGDKPKAVPNLTPNH